MSFADGINIDRARSLIASARTGTIGRPVISTRDWIRSEAEARLLRIFWSPLVGEGLCECVDVGARTTDASFIRIRERHEDKTRVKDALGFYSARSHPPPMDALGECLATIEDHGISPCSPANAVIKQRALEKQQCVRSVSKEIHETYRLTSTDAYEREKSESPWYGYGLFVLGGGSKVDVVVDSRRESVWPRRLAKCIIDDAGFPDDLIGWPSMGAGSHSGKTQRSSWSRMACNSWGRACQKWTIRARFRHRLSSSVHAC